MLETFFETLQLEVATSTSIEAADESAKLIHLNYRDHTVTALISKLCENGIIFPLATPSKHMYMLKVNNRSTGKKCKMCSKFTLKTPERRQLVSLLLSFNIFHTFFSCFFDVEQVNVCWTLDVNQTRIRRSRRFLDVLCLIYVLYSGV